MMLKHKVFVSTLGSLIGLISITFVAFIPNLTEKKLRIILPEAYLEQKHDLVKALWRRVM